MFTKKYHLMIKHKASQSIYFLDIMQERLQDGCVFSKKKLAPPYIITSCLNVNYENCFCFLQQFLDINPGPVFVLSVSKVRTKWLVKESVLLVSDCLKLSTKLNSNVYRWSFPVV